MSFPATEQAITDWGPGEPVLRFRPDGLHVTGYQPEFDVNDPAAWRSA